MMAAALLESLVLTGFLVLLSAVLPPAWLKDGFALKGFVFVGVYAATSILLQRMLQDSFPPPAIVILSFILPLVLIAFLSVVIRSKPKIGNFASNVQERMLIMLFVYVPLGMISLLFVFLQTVL